MRIGIINFHCAHNYGAMLQAYALQKNLQKDGHEVVIIDFEPYVIRGGYEIWNKHKFRHPKMLINTLINYKKLKIKYDIFEKFKKEYLNLTQNKYLTSEELINAELKYDAYICGSDQVWNMELNGGLTEYLLSFVKDKDAKKISYAASIGTKAINNKMIKVMKNELISFNSISVRESDAVRMIKNIFGIECTQVLDPVFLLSRDEWKKISQIPNKIEEPYVLLYGLEENKLFDQTLKFIYENLKLKIINISPKMKKSKYIYKDIYDVGPREFLGLMLNASLICTNSFHGTCFSIIFKKPFFTIAHSQLNSRIESILKLTNLEKHMINEEFQSIKEFEKVVNYFGENIDNLINEQIVKSKIYLKKSLLK